MRTMRTMIIEVIGNIHDNFYGIGGGNENRTDRRG